MQLLKFGVVFSLGLFFAECNAMAAEPTLVDLWPGRPPSQSVDPGDDKTSISNNGSLRITEVTRPQIKVVLAIANDDFLVERSVASYLALKKAGVSSELHIYATGGHGFGWNILHPPVPLVSDWTDRFEAWLRYQKLLGP